MINDFKKSSEWKICLTVKMNFMSSKDYKDKCLIGSNSDNE